MEVTTSERGFEWLEHDAYLKQESLPKHQPVHDRLASQSSAIGDYDDALERPGSSFLWIGEHHHLSREEVAEFIKHLQAWVATGSLTP